MAAKPLRAPLLLAVVVSPKRSHKVPLWEQEAVASGVAHALSLVLDEAGWGVMWRTGLQTRSGAVHRMHELKPGRDAARLAVRRRQAVEGEERTPQAGQREGLPDDAVGTADTATTTATSVTAAPIALVTANAWPGSGSTRSKSTAVDQLTRQQRETEHEHPGGAHHDATCVPMKTHPDRATQIEEGRRRELRRPRPRTAGARAG